MKKSKGQAIVVGPVKASRKRVLDVKRELFILFISFGLAVLVLYVAALPFFSIKFVEAKPLSINSEKKQLIIINKQANLKRFDEVYLKSPDDGQYVVRRIIGLPGDTVFLQEDQLMINGEEKAERYLITQKRQLKNETLTEDFTLEQLTEETSVPSDVYFVLSDNRKEDVDSRHYGFVQQTAVVGKVEN